MTEWVMDGTFYSAPVGFKQLYVVGALVDHSFFPCVFFLLPAKTEAIYEASFSKVFSSFPRVQQPRSVMIGGISYYLFLSLFLF
jgi:hypothetical protein